MQVVTDIAALRRALAAAGPVGFVPTMGNLHEGHLSLVRHVRREARSVVVSIFVNRLQFLPSEDFDRYPRTFERDRRMLEAEGVEFIFAPDERTLYPEPQTYRVHPPPMANELEGRFRPGFFEGVGTVVLKLFNCVQPAVAAFGKKDYQQLVVVRGMVRQLNLPISVIAAETTRETDGLAMSSRNQYLSADERREAPRLYRILREVKQGRPADDGVRELAGAGWQPDYIEVRRKSDLAAPGPADSDLIVLGAARLGNTRLIDNVEL